MKTAVVKKTPLLLIWPNHIAAIAEINVLDKIRDHRSNIIINLLDGQKLKEYLFFHFRIKNVSARRLQEINKMLMSMLHDPLDLIYYCTLIKKISCQTNSIFSDEDELYFHYEIERVIKKVFS